MPRYRLAKAAEHALNLDWLRTQLVSLRQQNLPHQLMLDRLDAHLAKDASVLRQLETALGTPGMEQYADALSYQLTGSFRALSEHYLGGLLHQTEREIRWRETLLEEIGRLGLNWISDLLVRLSRDLAILSSLRGDTSIPVLFAPPNQHESFLSLPGVYHELAHSAERQFPRIIVRLRQVIVQHYNEERTKVGPLPPKILPQSLREIDLAESYWDDLQLAEIFCDVFAGYACGPSNLLSMIDLARAQGSPQTSMDPGHPPHAARVEVCHAALEAPQQQDALAAAAFRDWRNLVARETPGALYRRCCHPQLIDKLAVACNEEIATHLPTMPRHTSLLPTLEAARVAEHGNQLREVIASGMVILWQSPGEFQVWRAKALPAAGLI